MTEGADAYQLPWAIGAACPPDLDFHTNYMIRCHSILWDPDFVSESAALARATILRSEVLTQTPQFGFAALRATRSRSSTSILRTKPNEDILQVRRKVAFHPFITVIDGYSPPVVEPLHFDELIAEDDAYNDIEFDTTCFMARQPRRHGSPDSPDLLDPPSQQESSESEPAEPSSPSTVQEGIQWQSVQVYDLRSNYARGRVRERPPEGYLLDVRRLLGYGHHDVAAIFAVTPAPQDLQSARIKPILLMLHDDIFFGDNRAAILIDVELHGSTWEDPIETDRYTMQVPAQVHRSMLLRLAGVERYCQVARNRCLIWHRGELVPLQRQTTLTLQHGDYVRIAVPPFPAPEVPTPFAVRACQHGLTPQETVQRFHDNPDPSDLHSEIEDDVEQHDDDQTGLLQLSSLPAQPDGPGQCALRFREEVEPPVFCTTAPGFLPHQRPFAQQQLDPSWFAALHEAFTAQAATACEEEGPIAFVTTWFLCGSVEQTSEESRTLRLDQFVQMWQQDIVDLWRDRIDLSTTLHFSFVSPEPPRHDTSWTIGHLIVHQRIERPITPVLIAIRMLSNTRTGIQYLAAALNNPTSAFTVRDKCNLARLCLERRCVLQRDARSFERDQEAIIRSGDGLVFDIHPPANLLHIGDEHISSPQWFTTFTEDAPEGFAAVPNLEDQTDFTVDLFEHWDVFAQAGPAGERLLRLPTWCLHGDRLRTNDEVRSVYFGDDFNAWESTIRRTWQDLLDPGLDVAVTIAWDPPGIEQDASHIHIIIFQQLQLTECANIITIYDDSIPGTRPYTTAAVLPEILGHTAILQAVHRERDCFPFNPYVVGATWHGGWQFHDAAPLRGQHGNAYMLILQRAQPQDRDHDDEVMYDPTATSSTNLIQIGTLRQRVRRQTAGQVAHTQRPERKTILLEHVIAPLHTVSVDFTPVLHIADELNSLQHHFGQLWPVDLPVPDTTNLALGQLEPIGDARPTMFHFYTDGSKIRDSPVGAAVVLIIETAAGQHYGGCLYKTLFKGTTSHAGEDGAIIWALLWAVHLSTEHWNNYGNLPLSFHFHFDSTSAGYVAAGYWRSPPTNDQRIVKRSLAQLLQVRHGFAHLHWEHVKAHTGHPWNEAVDALAKHATQQPLPVAESIWEHWITSPSLLVALQWIWYKELLEVQDPRVPSLAGGIMTSTLSLPKRTNQPPTLPGTESSTANTTTKVQFSFTIATANVLTLAGADSSSTSITRQRLLMQQFHDNKCAIVGVQETRHRHVTDVNNDLYHILAHSATSQGHDGIQLWISKKLLFDQNGTTIQKHHIKVVAATPCLLVAKIKLPSLTFAIITCRAPHSGLHVMRFNRSGTPLRLSFKGNWRAFHFSFVAMRMRILVKLSQQLWVLIVPPWKMLRALLFTTGCCSMNCLRPPLSNAITVVETQQPMSHRVVIMRLGLTMLLFHMPFPSMQSSLA